MTSSAIAIFIFNFLYISLGFYILNEIVVAISRVKNGKSKPPEPTNPTPTKDIFGNKNTKNSSNKKKDKIDKNDELIKTQQVNLSRALLVLSALLPIMILVPIHIIDPKAFYELANTFMQKKSLPPAAIYIISFIIGIGFSRLFLNPNSQNTDNEQPKNLGIIGKQLGYVEICYLSFALCIILFSFLENNEKMIVIKVTTTLFLAGNAFYLVFRKNIKMPTNLLSFLLPKKDDKNDKSSETNKQNELDI